MTIQKVTNWLLFGLSSDTKPTTSATNTLFYETNTGNIYMYTGSTWSLSNSATGGTGTWDPNATETLTNKSISGSTNTLSNIPDSALSSNVPLINAANVFTNDQKVRSANGTLLTFHRTVNSAGFGCGFTYNCNDAVNAEQTYGLSYVGIEDNTAASVRGDFYIQLAIAGVNGIRFRVGTSGSGGIIFGNNQRAILVETGLTGQRTFTLPDATVQLDGISNTATLTNKTLNATNNTITDSSTAAGDILKSNGTKFTRLARGTNTQVLASTSTDIAWTSLNSENAGMAVASGNGSTTVFNIAHGIGSTPTVYMAHVASILNTYTYTADATNIVVTFSSAPASGTNNIKIAWRAIA